MANQYEITDYEICKKTDVEAPGIAEAMFEYLPWPTLDISIKFAPTKGVADIVDNTTLFRYRIELK